MKNMKYIWKILCVIACLVIGLSVTLPYFSVSGLGLTVSKSLMDGSYGIFVLIVAGAALVLSVLGQYLFTALLGLVSLGLFFLQNGSVTTNLGKEINALARSMIQNGYGFYFLVVGSVALIVFSVLGLAAKKGK